MVLNRVQTFRNDSRIVDISKWSRIRQTMSKESPRKGGVFLLDINVFFTCLYMPTIICLSGECDYGSHVIKQKSLYMTVQYISLMQNAKGLLRWETTAYIFFFDRHILETLTITS